jgi:glycosyltransferase involved in cell wall biosynthesis
MPSVLILCEYGALNGGERSMLSTLGGLAEAGYEVRAAAPTEGPLGEALRSQGVEVIPLESSDPKGRRFSVGERRSRLADVLRARRPALLHANSLAMGRLSGPVAAELGVPSISHLRDIVALNRQVIADLNCHDCLLAVSEATRRYHVAQGLAVDRTHVLYNGIDTEQFRPAPPRRYLHDALGLPHDLPLLASIGQISLRKGLDTAAAALALLADDVPFAWLVIGQRHSDKDETRRLEDELHRTAQTQLAGRVFFLGTRDDVAGILPELTLLIHPARQEPLGRVLLEAAASGRAIVATDVGGTREIFPADSDAAVLVAPDGVTAMSRALHDLLKDPARRLQLGANARSRVESRFTIGRATAGLVGHYESVFNA